MNPSPAPRALSAALLCVLAAACHTAPPGSNPGVASEPRAPVVQPAQPVVAQVSEPQLPAAPVEDEFQKLLAGMGVRFLPGEQRLEIAGWVNMQNGLIEVFACAPQGKTHESVVVLDCVPSGLHAGLLALGLEPGSPAGIAEDGSYRAPTGDPVEVEVRWRDPSGGERVARAEDWIWDEKLQQTMPRAAWVFTGSLLQPVPGSGDAVSFAADYVKSLVTTYHDSTSILENPSEDGTDDNLYFSNDKAVPQVGTPITATFRRGQR